MIAVPNGVDTQQFLEDEGWIDLMDQKGEALFVLEPGAEAGAARRRRRPTWTPPLLPEERQK